MFNLKTKKKSSEVQVLQSSKKIVIFPCRITICKNGTDNREYEMLGYINEQTQYKFLYIKRSRKNGKYWTGFIRIPIDVADRLIKSGEMQTKDFSYEFKKL